MLRDLLDLVLPSACTGCGLAGTDLCAGCTAELTDAPSWRQLPGLQVACAGPYAEPASGALVAHKERGRLRLARPLGGALAAAVTALDPPSGVVLVPVPSTRAAVRARGHDHALRLARAASSSLAATGVPAVVRPLLVHVRRTRDQGGLRAAERADNLAGALTCRRAPSGVLVVVDDVLTTGATVLEAARALRAAGGDVLGAAAVAGAGLGRTGVPGSSVLTVPGGPLRPDPCADGRDGVTVRTAPQTAPAGDPPRPRGEPGHDLPHPRRRRQHPA